MVITRRSMLLGLGAALATPAIVRAENLMRVVVPKPHLITLDEFASRILDPLMARMERDHTAAMSDAISKQHEIFPIQWLTPRPEDVERRYQLLVADIEKVQSRINRSTPDYQAWLTDAR